MMTSSRATLRLMFKPSVTPRGTSAALLCLALVLVGIRTTRAAEPTDATAAPASPGVGILPPWLSLHQQFMASLGTDCRLRVDALQGSGASWQIVIHAPQQLASDLAMILRPSHTFGNVTVDVRVYDPSGTLVVQTIPASERQVWDACSRALRCNRFFSRLVYQSNAPPWRGKVVVFFRPAVIQYYNDNISDYFGNETVAAQSVFATFLEHNWNGQSTVKLSLTTEQACPTQRPRAGR